MIAVEGQYVKAEGALRPSEHKPGFFSDKLNLQVQSVLSKQQRRDYKHDLLMLPEPLFTLCICIYMYKLLMSMVYRSHTKIS
jgi:hypothetical protein